jgi:hypothetical protein
MKIKVKDLEFNEYWGPEQLCPFCSFQFMHKRKRYCCNCGKSFENVEWEKTK